MAETPISEVYPTRFSTPVSELDDHRQQPDSLPPANPNDGVQANRARRGTMRSIANERPDIQINDGLAFVEPVHDNVERKPADNENGSHGLVEGDKANRRESCTASNLLPGTSARPEQEPRNPSRASSHSSRSNSPPNSVEAFADTRRRERAGTVVSDGSSDTDLALGRTISGRPRSRRPTFSEVKSVDIANDASSRRSLAEEDVCFPQLGERGVSYTIDYEELSEFVAEYDKYSKTEIPKVNSPRQSAVLKPKIFKDLRPRSDIQVAAPGAADLESFSVHSGNEKENHGSDGEDVPDRFLPGQQAGMAEGTNRWTFFSSEMDNSVHAAELGGLLMPGESFRDLFELSPDGGVWWLDMFKPTEEEVTAICKAFKVHPLTKEDICTQETREKVELFKSYYFVCFSSFNMDKESEDFLEPVNVYAVVFREGLLTFTFSPNPHAANVRKRIGRLRDYLSLGADWICYALIDNIVDTFGPVIREAEHETDAIEDNVFTARVEDSRIILRAIGESRKKVMTLLRLLGGKADVIKGFAKRCNEQYSVAPRGDVGLYLSDIQDHVVTMMSNLGHFEKMLSRSHSNYLAQLSVDNITQGNQVNANLAKVTVIATILLPLNLICGMFGMNVPVPGGVAEGGSLTWFWGILGVIVAFVVVCLGTAKKMRYI